MTDKVKEIIDMVAALGLQWRYSSAGPTTNASIRSVDSERCPLSVLQEARNLPRSQSLASLTASLGGTSKDTWAVIEAADDWDYNAGIGSLTSRLPRASNALVYLAARQEVRTYLIEVLKPQNPTACT